jgi:hypothetical protein
MSVQAMVDAIGDRDLESELGKMCKEETAEISHIISIIGPIMQTCDLRLNAL